MIMGFKVCCFKVSGCSLDLFGQLITEHVLIPRSICAQFEYCCSLSSGGCMCVMLPASIARPSTYVAEVIGIC